MFGNPHNVYENVGFEATFARMILIMDNIQSCTWQLVWALSKRI